MSDKLTHQILSKSPIGWLCCGVVHIKIDTTIIGINGMALKILGLPKKEILNKKVFDVLKNYATRTQDNIFKTNFEKRKKGMASQYELIYTGPNGQKKNILVNATPIKDSKNKIIGSLALIFDITARTKAQHFRYQTKIKSKIKELKEQEIRAKALLEGQEITRNNVSKEIHDGIGQMLTAIKLNIHQIETDKNISRSNKSRLTKVRRMIKDSIIESRRISHFLSPAELNAHGLESSVSTLVNSLMHPGLIKFGFYSNIGKLRFGKEIEINIYRIIQEALLNIIQHSRSKNACIRLSLKNNKLFVSIIDDGIGFAFDIKQPKGIGLLNIIERCKIIKAGLKINSAIGKGTKIEITLHKKRT